MFPTILICFAALLILLAVFAVADCFRPSKFPPGPSFLPIIGNFKYYQKRRHEIGYHYLVWKELSEKYGQIVGLKLGRQLVVTVFGAKLVKEVLHREEFEGRPDGYFFRLRTFGKRLGVVFSDGELWKKQRKFAVQHLGKLGFGRKEMEQDALEESKSFIESLRRKCSEPIFMHNAFDICVFNGLWSMMAGRRFKEGDEKMKGMLKLIHDSFRLIDVSGGLLNQMPLLRYVAPNFCGYTQVMNCLEKMWKFMKESIEEHRKDLSHSQPKDFMEAFLQEMEKNKTGDFNDDQLISLCLDFFMAGAESTSNTLGFAVAYMILYPEIQKKVQQELDNVIGRNRWPCLADRPSLKYTEAVIMEIQRSMNVAPLGVPHRATTNTNLNGYQIPKNTIVLISIHSVHTDQEYWEDPFTFKPERFLKDREISVDEKYYFPFGQGKRRCLGANLAKTNIFLFFTALLHNFTIEPVEEFYPSLDPQDGFSLAPKPYKAKLVPRY